MDYKFSLLLISLLLVSSASALYWSGNNGGGSSSSVNYTNLCWVNQSNTFNLNNPSGYNNITISVGDETGDYPMLNLLGATGLVYVLRCYSDGHCVIGGEGYTLTNTIHGHLNVSKDIYSNGEKLQNFNYSGNNVLTGVNNLSITNYQCTHSGICTTFQGKSDGGFYTYAPIVIKNTNGQMLGLFGGSGTEGINDYGNYVLIGNSSVTQTIISDLVFADLSRTTADKRTAVIRVLRDTSATTTNYQFYINNAGSFLIPMTVNARGIQTPYNLTAVKVFGNNICYTNGTGCNNYNTSYEKFAYNQTCSGMTLYNSTLCSQLTGTTIQCLLTAPASGETHITGSGFLNGTTSMAYANLLVNGAIVDIGSHQRSANSNPTSYTLQNITYSSGLINATIQITAGANNLAKIRMEAFKTC